SGARDPLHVATRRARRGPRGRPGHRRRAGARAPASRRSEGDLMAILVFVEQRDGSLRSIAREALGEASRLVAAGLPGPVIGVCAAASDPGLAALGDAGASEILLAAQPSFERYDARGYTAAVVAAVEQTKPAVVLFPASSMGRDLAPRVAARLDAGLAS